MMRIKWTLITYLLSTYYRPGIVLSLHKSSDLILTITELGRCFLLLPLNREGNLSPMKVRDKLQITQEETMEPGFTLRTGF